MERETSWSIRHGGFIEKVRFERKLEGNNGSGKQISRGKAFQVEEQGTGSMVHIYLACSKRRQEAKVPGAR